MNRLFLIAELRNRPYFQIQFEVEFTGFNFDDKTMCLRLVHDDDRPKTVALGLELDQYGNFMIDVNHDYEKDDIAFIIISDPI